MEKTPYFFEKCSLETGKRFAPTKYECFFVISPDKMYLFYISDVSNEFTAGLLGGAIGKAIFRKIKKRKAEKTNKMKADDFKELPFDLRRNIPNFNRVVVISKESAPRIKFPLNDLTISLKNEKWFRMLMPLNKTKKAKSYLKLTSWI